MNTFLSLLTFSALSTFGIYHHRVSPLHLPVQISTSFRNTQQHYLSALSSTSFVILHLHVCPFPEPLCLPHTYPHYLSSSAIIFHCKRFLHPPFPKLASLKPFNITFLGHLCYSSYFTSPYSFACFRLGLSKGVHYYHCQQLHYILYSLPYYLLISLHFPTFPTPYEYSDSCCLAFAILNISMHISIICIDLRIHSLYMV